MFAIVENDEQTLLREIGEERFERRTLGRLLKVQRTRNRVGYRRIAERGEIDEPNAVWKSVQQLHSDLRGDPRFPDSARSDNADDWHRLYQIGDLSNGVVASE